MTSMDKLIARVDAVRYDPAGIQGSMIDLLGESLNSPEKLLVDPSNPFIYTLSVSSACAASCMIENKTLTRKTYPLSAQTDDEIYIHMSDKDFTDRFALPSSVKFIFSFVMSDLLNKLVDDPSNPGVRKIIIPRNTYVEVAGLTFGIEYPIIIRQLAHGGLQAVYDVEEVSPLETKTTNVIEPQIRTADDGTEWFMFEVDFRQFLIDVKTSSIDLGRPTLVQIGLTKQHYYARVWLQNVSGGFDEIETTYTDATYDVNKPTAVLKVANNTLTVKLPQVYVNSGLATRQIRVDSYQTEGIVEKDLADYGQNQVKVVWRSIADDSTPSVFTAPLATLNPVVHSPFITRGGRDAMTTEELRQRMVRNAKPPLDVPITPAQREDSLNRPGYTVVKNIDQITNRDYLATRAMPQPSNEDLITAAAAGISLLPIRISDIAALPTVVDNGDIVTVNPDTLYRWKAGVLEIVPDAEVQYLKALPPDQLAVVVSTDNFLYSPFHYVLDSSGNEFNVRPYYLDSPEVVSRSFIQENDKTNLQVATDLWAVQRTANGYKLRLQTRSSEEYKAINDNQVAVQLAFRPRGDSDYAYLLGTQVGRSDNNERIFEFNLETNYRLNDRNELGMTKFQQFVVEDRIVMMPLDVSFEVLHSTSIIMPPSWQASTMENLLGVFQLPTGSHAITHERMEVVFGNYLEHLWARSRTVVSSEQYETYAIDIPALYPADVYDRDPVTGATFEIVNGEVVYNIVHHKDDPILDGNGDPVFAHRAGDVKLDQYGQPIVRESRGLLRQIDIFVVEGSYFFATNDVTIAYRTSLVKELVTRLVKDMETMGESLLENTNLSYYPTTTIGSVDVMYREGLVTTIQAGQALQLTLYARSQVVGDLKLRRKIEQDSIRLISEQFTNRTVSHSDTIDKLKAQYGKDVIAFDLSLFGGSAQLSLVTMMDDSQRLSLRKRLVARNDSTLALVEDVTINWVLHQRTDLVVA